MNDANDATDVSLETDRLEQLLEVPAPAHPVVMIEYRNRGVPWWLVISLVVLVPLVALVIYQQFVVVRYQQQASRAAYLAQQMANQRASELPPPADVPAPDPA